jgi:lipopolysaccharide/colanic/teichoic acid biosynthesis glycosyltransferase
VADIFSFYETCTGRAPIFCTQQGWLFRAQHRAPDQFAYACKRVFDLILTALALPMALPTVVIAAALVKLTSPGPALFVQRRIGFRGQEFSLLKLRTMHVAGERGDDHWTGRDDPRVTPVGRVLRVLGLDELPQLWNVLRGELSLVGPRPEQPEVVRRLVEELPPYLQRHVVPCGITGWAQIRRGSDLDLADVLDKVRLDLFYARHFSLWLDALILLRTFQMLLARAKPAPAALAPRAGERAARPALGAASGGPRG